MRGNHICLGRQDYTEPDPISAADRAAVACCQIGCVEGKKTWYVVRRDGNLLGYVSTRMGGQVFRDPETDDWSFAANDWARTEPPHARAVLALIRHIDSAC
jgi:hypothetical protein